MVTLLFETTVYSTVLCTFILFSSSTTREDRELGFAPTEKEIRKALGKMAYLKSPGPNRMNQSLLLK